MGTGTLAIGVLDGMLIGLLAVGLVLVYRSNRFLNLAHAQLGALPALMLSKLVLDAGWSYWAALPLCVLVGILTGIAVQKFFIARLAARRAPTVSYLLLTLGLTQLMISLTFIEALKTTPVKIAAAGYPVPISTTMTIGGIILGGQYVIIIILVPALVIGLALFLRYSLMGKMIRALASNRDAARLCAISPALVSAVTWGIAGGLSTVSAILVAPSQPRYLGAALGSSALLFALGAAAFGAFVSIPGALVGGLVIGVADTLVAAETSNAGTAKITTFILIMAVVFLRGRAIGAVFAHEGAPVGDRSPVRVPKAVRDRPIVRRHLGLLAGAALFVAVLAPLLPAFDGQGDRFKLSLILIYAVVGISLTMVIGWGGQLSLGHMGIVGVGAFMTARLSDDHSLLFIAAVAGALGAGLLLVVGLPALRVRGLTLAVTTLGLAVVSSEWLFVSQWFTGTNTSTSDVTPLTLVSGVGPADSMLKVYWIALTTLVLAALVARAIRRSTPGRLMIAVRDDERASAAYGVTPATVKLGTLAVSGCFAGIAGVLWAAAWATASPEQFSADLSLAVIAVPVVGGVGSVAGAIAGAGLLYYPALFFAQHFEWLFDSVAIQAGFQLLYGGLLLIVVMMWYPTGLAGLAQRWWERFLARVASQLKGQPTADDVLPVPALVASDVSVSFGGLKALQDASIEVRPGEIVGLIGPNGAGKSTLLNVVSGVVRSNGGTIELFGKDVSNLPPEMRAAYGMGRSFQAANLFPGLTVRETIQAMLGARARIGLLSSMVHAPWAARAEREASREADDLLAQMGLDEWADTLAADLSTGTRRICDLTVQVAGKAKLLVLDEPTAGIAQREAEAFGPLLRRVRDDLDCAVLIVEHDVPLLRSVCDRIYAMAEGEVIAEGTPDQVLATPAVIASYLGTDEAAIERSGTRSTRTGPNGASLLTGAKAAPRTPNGRRRAPLAANPSSDEEQ